MSLNKRMGDAHEAFLEALFEGKASRGSGNQWRNPMDGRTSRHNMRFAFAWDGKSTLRQSLSIPLSMIAKAREQAGGERPMIGLRWYKNEALEVDKDWVAVNAHDMAEVLEAANKMAVIEEIGCLEGNHEHGPVESDSVPGMFVKRGPCRGCARFPYEASRVGCC
jgi:hypothetical protein